MRLFTPKKGKAIKGFREAMIRFWMEDEYISRTQALRYYGGKRFELLCERLEDTLCLFNPDLGYSDKSIDGTLCFESIDNNFVIPVNLIKLNN